MESNEWTTITTINNLPFIIMQRMHGGRVACGKDFIYLINTGNQLMVIRKDNFYWEIIEDVQISIAGPCVVINDKLNVIGGYWNDKHLVFDRDNERFEIAHDLQQQTGWRGIGKHTLVQMEDTSLYTFGGDNLKARGHNDIYYLNKEATEWALSEVKLPAKLRNLACTSVVKERFILLFAGEQDPEKGDYWPWEDNYEIYIFDIKQNELRKSRIRCPIKGRAKAMTFIEGNEKTVHGWLRETWKLFNIDDRQYPPHYLVKIMERYYVTEWIHLLYNKYNTMRHFKVRVKDILHY